VVPCPDRVIKYFTHGPTLAYRTFGRGPLPVLAFHGFGRSGEDFQLLQEQLGDRCTLYAFDLHFHGQSPAYPHRADTPFTPAELADYFTTFMDQMGVDKSVVLGYSLGGRIALNLLEQVPERITCAFLAAPDGLKTRPWYRGMVASKIGRLAYRRFVERPGAVHALIHASRGLGLIHDRLHRFLIGQTDSRSKRELVRNVWMSYRLIEPDLRRVASNARQHAIPIHLFFGERDRIIKPVFGRRLRDLAPEQVTQEELPFGHVLITPELGRAIAAHLG